jgi:hypothetical protein
MVFTVGGFANPDDYDDSRIDMVDLTTGARTSLLKGARMAIASAKGVLLLARIGVLSAVKLDEERRAIVGEPVPVVQGVAGDKTTGASHVAYASDARVLAVVPGDPQGSLLQMVWADKQGVTTPALDVPPASFLDPSLSPDGGRAAVAVGNAGATDVWVYDFARRTFTRFTFGGNNTTPIWSADARMIYYATIEPLGTRTTIYRRPSDGSREAEVVASVNARSYLKQVNEARGELLIDSLRNLQQGDIERLRFGSGAAAAPESLVSSTFDETAGSLSPDERWLAYASDETGRYEVYVRAVTGPGGGRWQVSTASGEEPRWSPDGRRLFYRSNSRFMAVPVTLSERYEAGTPVMLFDGAYEYRSDTAVTYSYDPKRERFLMIRPAVSTDQSDRVRVLLNWSPGLVR